MLGGEAAGHIQPGLRRYGCKAARGTCGYAGGHLHGRCAGITREKLLFNEADKRKIGQSVQTEN